MRVFSHGKLMITGEYLVLDGALSFAVPTRKGQYLELIEEKRKEHFLKWTAYNSKGEIWLEAEFLNTNFYVETDNEAVLKLGKILKIVQEHSLFFKNNKSYTCTTQLDFDASWGLGSSSTLLANLSKLTGINPFILADKTVGGSGYDIAVGMEGKPVIYYLNEKSKAGSNAYQTTKWDPVFKDQLFFVHLNQKMNTNEAIKGYQGRKIISNSAIDECNGITTDLLLSSDLAQFEALMTRHEDLIASVTGLPKVKDRLFSDYEGLIKSLGSWGGDFILASGPKENYHYFQEKGYNTIVPYSEMIL